MTSLLERRLARCTCALQTEPQAVAEAKRRRRNTVRVGWAFHIKEAPSMDRRWHGVWWDPNETETDWNGELHAKTFWGGPGQRWLRWRDFFMSDTLPRPPRCHHYCEVEIGQTCHKCKKKVVAQWSGIACPCKHTWYCA